MGRETLTMPRLGETMDEGRLVAWLVAPGEPFARGDVLAEVETDKTVVELPALSDGTMARHLAEPGADIAVGAPLAEIATDASPDDAPAPADDASSSDAPAAAGDKEHAALSPATHEARAAAALRTVERPASRVRATPAARALARRLGIDLAGAVGTGRRGRIEVGDIAAPSRETGRGRQLDVEGGTIVYDVHGPADAAGGTTLLIHGFAAERGEFAVLAGRLADRHRVIVPDCPGHGDTTVDAATLADVTRPLAALVEDVRGPLRLIGHSMGAAASVRLAVALAEGDRAPEALILVAPAGLGAEVDHAFLAAMADGPSPGALHHLLRKLRRDPPDLSDAVLQRMAARFRKGRLRTLAATLATPHGQGVDITRDLHRLAAKTRIMIVVGTHDAIIPWTQVANAPPEAAIHVVRAGHMVHLDAPDTLAALCAMDRGGAG